MIEISNHMLLCCVVVVISLIYIYIYIVNILYEKEEGKSLYFIRSIIGKYIYCKRRKYAIFIDLGEQDHCSRKIPFFFCN